jgi:hypothetical protein
MPGRQWTKDEVEFLRTYYQTKNLPQLAQDLDRTIKAVQHKLSLLKLERPKPQPGDKFHRLTIDELYSIHKYGQHITIAKCNCQCGNQYVGKLTAIVTGHVKSCGCLKRETSRDNTIKRNLTHGSSSTKLYKIWAAAKNRCNNPHNTAYNDYGGRGIVMCQKWQDNFEAFQKWALANGYVEGLSLDRINVNGNYSPQNCRWVTMYEQSMNRRNSLKVNITAFGETKSIHEWVGDKRCVVSTTTLCYRIGAGWTPEDAITKPSERR